VQVRATVPGDPAAADMFIAAEVFIQTWIASTAECTTIKDAVRLIRTVGSPPRLQQDEPTGKKPAGKSPRTA
jgi:hypothetical protein